MCAIPWENRFVTPQFTFALIVLLSSSAMLEMMVRRISDLLSSVSIDSLSARVRGDKLDM